MFLHNLVTINVFLIFEYEINIFIPVIKFTIHALIQFQQGNVIWTIAIFEKMNILNSNLDSGKLPCVNYWFLFFKITIST